MNPANYKDLVNSRGYKYHYYAVPAKQNKLTVLFVHGFPQSSRDWRLIAPAFEDQGYGIIVPDMLAYGGTDKPTDYKEYQFSLLTKDLVDILDAERVQQAVAVGHDWGAMITSRLSNFYPNRFMAYAFMNVPYGTPNPQFNAESLMATAEKAIGYNPFGYWYFFSEDGADQIVLDHIDAFINTLFPKDPKAMVHAFTGKGALKKSLLEGFTTDPADFMRGEERQLFIDSFRRNGFAAPFCYYKIMVNDARTADDATVPPERMFPPVSSPLFFGAAHKDPVCLASFGKTMMSREEFKNHSVTIKDFDGDHWLMLYPEIAASVKHELLAWVENVVTPAILKTRM